MFKTCENFNLPEDKIFFLKSLFFVHMNCIMFPFYNYNLTRMCNTILYSDVDKFKSYINFILEYLGFNYFKFKFKFFLNLNFYFLFF
jgi:hypothetical protein